MRKHTITCGNRGCGRDIPPGEKAYPVSSSTGIQQYCFECYQAHQEFYADPKNRRKSTT